MATIATGTWESHSFPHLSEQGTGKTSSNHIFISLISFSPLTVGFYLSHAERGKLKQQKQEINNLFVQISAKGWNIKTPNTHLYYYSPHTHLLIKVLPKLEPKLEVCDQHD